MSAEAESPAAGTANPETRGAWQPLTFGGVAAFANAPWRRLLAAQALAALLFAAGVVWFFAHCYAPVIAEEIQKLPDGAKVTGGQLAGVPGVKITETRLLSIAVTSDEDADMDQSADVQIALRQDRLEVSSILSSALGSLEIHYPMQSYADLSRSRLEPLWGAWLPVLLVQTGTAVVVGLWLLWAVMAWCYAPVAKLAAWFCDRQLTWPGAWRLSCAALLPGALLMTVGVVFYGSQVVDVFGLGYFAIVHLLVGWVYLLGAPFFAPRLISAPMTRNPFHP